VIFIINVLIETLVNKFCSSFHSKFLKQQNKLKQKEELTIFKIQMTANMDLERIKATTTSLPLYPEFDSPKLFVSHIPTHLTTNDLKQIFSEFGTIYELQLLFHTDQTSKGCCFVRFHTFDAAQRAQTALHDQRFLPPSKYPLQIKLADFSLDRRDRKLFVGMLSHSLVEEDLAHIFDRFGHIEDCTVLRDSDGKSRGCAFITFATKESANEAIDTVHRSMRMEGCSSPINVKLAEGGGEERKGSLSERGMQNRRISLQCEKKSRWSDETRKYFSPTRLSFDAESVGQRQLVGPKDSNVFVYNLPVG